MSVQIARNGTKGGRKKDPRAGTDLDWVHWVLGVESGIDTGSGVEGSNECGENERVGEHG